MKPPFDIAGDLDTPVSAFAKLGAFNPRFLLESVEGGERLARYSFIGFGKCLEVKLDAAGLTVGSAKLPRPANKAELLDALRKALAAAPKPLPEMAGVPLAGGLVGYSSYDVVRYFERLPSERARRQPGAGPALRGARVHAGVRSPDARHRAAARRHRGRAPGAAPRGDRRAARRHA